jgi:hypothetical protein
VAIGHPAAGLLWSVRSGEVSGVGNWPHEMIDAVMARLSAEVKDRERVNTLIANMPKRRVVLSTCGLNPGDSGGPLVNIKGELIGVSFAVPRSDPERGVSLAKFSYHVHLDEVKAFLADRPAEPQVAVPDPWPTAVYCARLDLDDDGMPDTLAFGMERGQQIVGLVLDLDQDSDPEFKPSQLASPAGRRAWDFEFAIQRSPLHRTFYDTDNNGTIDLILTDNDQDGEADAVLRLNKGTWAKDEARGRKMIDQTLLDRQAMRERLVRILRNVARE